MTRTGTTIAGFEITVRELDRAADFYSAILGLCIRARVDQEHFREVLVAGNGDTVQIALVHDPEAGDSSGVPSVRSNIVLHVEDLQALYKRAIKAGAEEVQAPKCHAGSEVSFAQIRDLDGHALMLVQRGKSH